MGKKLKKRDIDDELLEAFYAAEQDWKQIKSLMEHSVDAPPSTRQLEAIAQAKYMFLLREVRHRKINAFRIRS